MQQISHKSVLIIDDDDGMRRALKKVLTSEGSFVSTTPCAEDAIEILTARQTPVDLVITDLWMPSVTGMAVLYVIHELFPTLPVIVLTAYGSPEVKAECVRQGARAVLEKPLNTPQLLDAIQSVFASQKAVTAIA